MVENLWFNSSVLQAKGDRLVRARALPVDDNVFKGEQLLCYSKHTEIKINI